MMVVLVRYTLSNFPIFSKNFLLQSQSKSYPFHLKNIIDNSGATVSRDPYGSTITVRDASDPRIG